MFECILYILELVSCTYWKYCTSSLVKEMWIEPFSLKIKLDDKVSSALLSPTCAAAETFLYENDCSALIPLKSGPASSSKANSLFGNGKVYSEVDADMPNHLEHA
jgi:hypothetical protein